MACPLCGGNHLFHTCIKYATATQPLKDLLVEIYNRLETVKAAVAPDGIAFEEYSEAIYYGFYQAMTSLTPAQYATIGDDDKWVWYNSTVFAEYPQNALAAIRERIYINTRPDRVVHVFERLKPVFREFDWAVIRAKRCGPMAGLYRRDMIVIYMISNPSTRRLLGRIRQMIESGALDRSDFRTDVPPCTGRVSDLPGVSVGSEPRGPIAAESFGSKLSNAIAAAWIKHCRPVPMANKWDWVCKGLAELSAAGIDIKRPWDVSLS